MQPEAHGSAAAGASNRGLETLGTVRDVRLGCIVPFPNPPSTTGAEPLGPGTRIFQRPLLSPASLLLEPPSFGLGVAGPMQTKRRAQKARELEGILALLASLFSPPFTETHPFRTCCTGGVSVRRACIPPGSPRLSHPHPHPLSSCLPSIPGESCSGSQSSNTVGRQSQALDGFYLLCVGLNIFFSQLKKKKCFFLFCLA